MQKIKIATLQFSNQKICEYCYLEDLAYLTTIMRIKAIQQEKIPVLEF
ncbi:hypothetical protein ACT7DB_30695 [Bacillus cereus]